MCAQLDKLRKGKLKRGTFAVREKHVPCYVFLRLTGLRPQPGEKPNCRPEWSDT